MVAIRNRNTNVPHVFRYPKYETDIFYPAGSLVSYPVQSPRDSDEAYFDFYVSKFDVPSTKNIVPPNDTATWKLIMSTSQASGDSELENRLLAIEDSVTNLRLEHDSDNIITRTDHDSDMLMAYHDFRSADSDIGVGDLRDSKISSLIDGNILAWNDSDQYWENKTLNDILPSTYDYGTTF